MIIKQDMQIKIKSRKVLQRLSNGNIFYKNAIANESLSVLNIIPWADKIFIVKDCYLCCLCHQKEFEVNDFTKNISFAQWMVRKI